MVHLGKASKTPLQDVWDSQISFNPVQIVGLAVFDSFCMVLDACLLGHTTDNLKSAVSLSLDSRHVSPFRSPSATQPALGCFLSHQPLALTKETSRIVERYILGD